MTILNRETMELMEEVAISRSEAEEKARNEITDKDESEEIRSPCRAKKDSILPEAFAMVKETCRRMCSSAWNVVGRK